MGHNHSHQHNHSHEKGLSTAFWLNAIFSVIEVVGGIFTNSTAIIADAFHDFVDASAIGLAVFLEKISKKKRVANRTSESPHVQRFDGAKSEPQ